MKNCGVGRGSRSEGLCILHLAKQKPARESSTELYALGYAESRVVTDKCYSHPMAHRPGPIQKLGTAMHWAQM